MNNPLLVGVLDGVADFNEQGKAVFGVEIVFVAIFGDRHAGD